MKKKKKKKKKMNRLLLLQSRENKNLYLSVVPHVVDCPTVFPAGRALDPKEFSLKN